MKTYLVRMVLGALVSRAVIWIVRETVETGLDAWEDAVGESVDLT